MNRSLARAVVLSLAVSAVSAGATRVVSVGGGPQSASNQLSLEKNVTYFRDVLGLLHADAAPHDVLFADAGRGGHSVQYLVPENADTKFADRLAVAMGFQMVNENKATHRYRRVDLPGVSGPADTAAVGGWFDVNAKTFKPGDRLLFYYTGHGSGDATNPQQPRDTTMDLWNSPPMTVRQFEKELDKLGPTAETLLVMVQCHSGGFANVIYVDGDPAKGLAAPVRYGYFSTIAPRLAAGCTSDIQGDDYQEFSTAFFAALCGRTRGGRTVETPDFDRDGRTTMDEAFASVLLSSDTIDLPMTTSDRLLRDFSRFDREPVGGPVATTAATTRRSAASRATTLPAVDGLLGRDVPFATVLNRATPSERAALTGLVAALGITDAEPIPAARKLVADMERQSRDERQSFVAIQKAFEDARLPLRKQILIDYPELSMPFMPSGAGLLNGHFAEVRAAVEAMPGYAAFVRATDKVIDTANGARQRERRWVKTQRLLERFNTVVLAANLDKVAANDVVERFKLLRTKESGTLQ